MEPKSANNMFESLAAKIEKLYNFKCVVDTSRTRKGFLKKKETKQGSSIHHLHGLQKNTLIDIRNILLVVNTGSDDSMSNFLKVDFLSNSSSIYLHVIIDQDSTEDNVESVINWIDARSEQVVLVSVEVVHVLHGQLNIEDYGTYVEALLKLFGKCHPKCMFAYKASEASGNNFCGNDLAHSLDTLMVRHLIILLEQGLDVIKFCLYPHSLSQNIEEWKLLERLLQPKNNIVEAIIRVVHGTVSDISRIEKLFSTIKSDTFLFLPKKQSLNFSSSLIEHIHFRVKLNASHGGYLRMPTLQGSLQETLKGSHSLKISFRNRVCETIVLDSSNLFEYIKNIDNDLRKRLFKLSFTIGNALEQVGKEAIFAQKSFITEIANVVETMPNVFEVHIQGANLVSDKDKGEILSILKERETKRMKYLIVNNRKGRYNRAKLMVIGAGGAGKTSLCRSLLGKKFIPEHKSTAVGECEMTATIDTTDVDISAWREVNTRRDIVTSDLLTMKDRIKNDEIEGRVGHNVNTEYSERVYKPHEDISKLLRDNAQEFELPVNPSVQRNNSIWFSKKLYRPMLESSSMKLVTTNPKNRKLSIWDFGGQKVFNVLHHLYLTNAGLVLLVVDLSVLVNGDEIAVEDIKVWFRSLCVYTKSVNLFIVGTRAKKLNKKGIKKINEMLKKIIVEYDGVRLIRNGEGNQALSFFPVENSLGKRNEKFLAPLKASILKLLDHNEKTITLPINKKIPLAWMFFIQLIHRDKGNIESIGELFAKGQVMGFEYDEMKSLVNFFTNSGIIIGFHDKFVNNQRNSEEIIDDVVLRPEWLLSSLSSFIFDNSLHLNEIDVIGQEPNMGKLVQVYKRHGVLAELLLNNILSKKKLTSREKKFIKNLCFKMLIMSKLQKIPKFVELRRKHVDISKGFWLVPSMNTIVENDKMNIHLSPNHKTLTTGMIKWDDIVPQGLFERCICSLLDHADQEMQLVFLTKSIAQFAFKGYALNIIHTNDREYGISIDTIKPSVLFALKHLLALMNEEVNQLGFVLKINANLLLAENIEVNMLDLSKRPEPQIGPFIWDCFLSHTWGKHKKTHERVLNIAKLLSKQGVKVWIDEHEMRHNIVNQMLEGMNGSACFIAFITKEYLEASDNPNSNAGREIHYASKLGIENMIPVLLDKKFSDPRSWKYAAGLFFGSALYIDFTSDLAIERNLTPLCSRIKDIVARRTSE